MKIAYYIPLSLFFIIIGIGMNFVNKITKSKMKLVEKIIVIICITTSISMAALGTITLMNNKTESLKNTYSGYVYLLEGSIEKAEQCFDEELELNEDDPFVLYGKSKISIIRYKYDESKKILERALARTKDEELRKIIEMDLEELKNINQHSIEDIEKSVNSSANKVVSILGDEYRSSINKIDKYVSIEQKLNSDQGTYKIENVLNEMIENNNKDFEAKRLLAKTYLQNGRYEEAYEEMKSLIAQEKDLSNLILLSDIVAEAYYNDRALIDEDDREIKKLNKKIEKIDKDIEKINEDNFLKTIIKKNDSNERLEKLEVAKGDIEREKQEVVIKRTINYLRATISLDNESSTIKNLQIAKLYYVLGENKKSKVLINDINSEKNLLSTRYDTTAKVLDEYNEHLLKSREEKDENKIRKTVNAIINNVNSELTEPMKASEMNEGWEDFLVAYAKYSSTPISITRIDTDNYPHITSYVNIGGERQGWFYLNKTFNKSDFKVEDTKKEIVDFTVKKVNESNTNICLVIDSSGSMEGKAVRDAKNASIEFIRNIGRNNRVGIVSFSDDIETLSTLSKDKTMLESTINSIYASGGTRLYDAGIDGVNKVKNESGRNIVVLLTDGNDTDSHAENLELIESANSNGVTIYTIGLGEVQADILGEIALKTNGKFYMAPNSAELSMIYEEILKKLNNTYEFNYTITENSADEDRYSKIALIEDQGTDTKTYTIKNNSEIDPDENYNTDVVETIQQPVEEIPEYEFIPIANIENKLLFKSLDVNQIIKASNKSHSIIINGSGFDKNGLKIMVGKYDIDKRKIEILSDNKVKVTLPLDIDVGKYTIYGENELGEKTSLENALTITVPSKVAKIYLGDMTIKADRIDQTEQGYSAEGNIVINDYIYINSPINIDTKGVHNSEHKYYSGLVNGDGKMYVKFNRNTNNFAVKIFKSYEQILDHNEFQIESRNGGSYIHNKAVTDVRIMTPIMQFQPLRMKILKAELEITTGKFYLAGLDDESKERVKNSNWFTRKVPLWVSTTEIKILINSGGYSLQSGEIWFEDTVVVVPKIMYLKKLILKTNLPEGLISARGTIMLGTVFPKKLSNKLGLEFNLETKGFNLDTIEILLNYSIPLYKPYLYLEKVGGGVSELAGAERIRDSRLMLIGACSSFKLPKLPIIAKEHDIAVLELSRMEVNTKLSAKQVGFKGKAKFLTSEIADLMIHFEPIEQDPGFVFILNGKTYIDYEWLSYKFNLNTELDMSVGENGFYNRAKGDLHYQNLIWELEGACTSEIVVNEECVQYKIEMNNGKDDIYFLLRLKSRQDKPLWNIGSRIEVKIDF